MGHLWTFITNVYSFAGPALMLLYPLYASVMSIETSKTEDEQWLPYWILYSFLTLMEMLLDPLLQCFFFGFYFLGIPIWYDMKLILVAWLVLPQFKGAAFLYQKIVREKLMKHAGLAIKGKIQSQD